MHCSWQAGNYACEPCWRTGRMIIRQAKYKLLVQSLYSPTLWWACILLMADM